MYCVMHRVVDSYRSPLVGPLSDHNVSRDGCQNHNSWRIIRQNIMGYFDVRFYIVGTKLYQLIVVFTQLVIRYEMILCMILLRYRN